MIESLTAVAEKMEIVAMGQQISFQNIADHPDVLQASLKNTLGPP